MSVRLCIGNYASHSYRFEGLSIQVYCMEELCYTIRENAFLLDMDIMSDRLVEWIGRDCGLPQLAEELHALVHKKGSLSAFVGRILEYTGFYSAETMRQIEQTLKKGAGLTVLEKRKLRIDHLTEQKKYLAAVSEYDGLLASWEEEMGGNLAVGSELRAAILHNRGRALAGLMRYAQAADSYRKAYETDQNLDSMKCFLAAKRMELRDQEYIAYAASVPDSADVVLELEEQIEQLNTLWQQEADYLRMMERGYLRGEDERSYLEDTAFRLQALKESYRSMVG